MGNDQKNENLWWIIIVSIFFIYPLFNQEGPIEIKNLLFQGNPGKGFNTILNILPDKTKQFQIWFQFAGMQEHKHLSLYKFKIRLGQTHPEKLREKPEILHTHVHTQTQSC